jgi:hypothetical protein
MPVYRLIPVDLSDAWWQASSHRGVALVRAGSEKRARELALLAFAIAVDTRAGTGLASPWLHPDKVRVEVVTDTAHPSAGPEGVLEPSRHG